MASAMKRIEYATTIAQATHNASAMTILDVSESLSFADEDLNCALPIDDIFRPIHVVLNFQSTVGLWPIKRTNLLLPLSQLASQSSYQSLSADGSDTVRSVESDFFFPFEVFSFC